MSSIRKQRPGGEKKKGERADVIIEKKITETLQRLLKDKSINIPELELSSTTPEASKAPVTVRIRHKIQRNI